jgi:hypothetical protein
MKTCLLVGTRARFFLGSAFFFMAFVSLAARLITGQIYSLKFVDVDDQVLSTADGHVTVVVLTTSADVTKARAVGDRVPDYCLANPTYRMISVLTFERKHSKPVRMIMTSLMRRRLDSEARRLQLRYKQLKIARDARRDVFAVADFDGAIRAQLDSQSGDAFFHVFVFDRNGELLKEWNDVPPAEELTGALKPN